MKRILFLLALLPSLIYCQHWNEKIVFKIHTDSSVYYSYHIAKFDGRVEVDSAWLNNILKLPEIKVKDSANLTNSTIVISDIKKITISKKSPIVISSAQSLGINTEFDRKIKKDYISRIEEKFIENVMNDSMEIQFSDYYQLKRNIKRLQIAGVANSSTENSNIKYGSFKDSRDGKIYKTIQIGNQVWMAENLAYTPSLGKYWAYDNNSANVAVYGYLYDWETANKECPSGWHLPSDTEWTELTDYLGGKGDAGGKLKETGTTHWIGGIPIATNETGFTALPGGRRTSNGRFTDVGYIGYWWSASEGGSINAWRRDMFHNDSKVYRGDFGKDLGFSVRCLRN